MQNIPWRKPHRPHHPPEAPVMARNDLPRMIKDMQKAAADAAYNAPARTTENITRELQIKGPGWTGRFSNSWTIRSPLTVVKGSQAAGQAQKLTVPRISGTQVKRLYKNTRVVFTVFNTADYAGVAVDKEVGTFMRVGTPIKPVEKTGTRVDGIRGKLTGTGGNIRTAPYNWFSISVLGGAMDKTISTTLSRALR